MDILLTMVKLHELSDIYIPDANDRLFLQYLTTFANDINAYAASPRYAQGQATTVSVFCMLVGLDIAPSKMVARGCYTDKYEYQDILVSTLSGEAAAIPIITDHNMQQTTYDTLLRYLGIHAELDHSWQGQHSLLHERIAQLTRILTNSRASLPV